MNINIRKQNNEEFEQEGEEWDMPVSGEAGQVQVSNLKSQNSEPKNSEFKDLNTSEFKDSNKDLNTSEFKDSNSGFKDSNSGAGADFKVSEAQYSAPRIKMKEVTVNVGAVKMLFWWENISRWALILFAGLTPIFFLPFTQLPVAVHKELLVFILTLVALFALLGKVLIEGRIRYPGHLLSIALVVLVLVWGASAFFSLNPLTSLIGGWSTPDSFASILLFVILTLATALAFSRRDIILSLLVFIASLSILGIFEMLQLFKVFVLPYGWSQTLIFNPVGSINHLGVLLAFGLIIAAGLISSFEISTVLKKLLGVAVVIYLANLIAIDFWAIWIGLAAAMVLLISFALLNLQDHRKPDQDSFGEGMHLVYFSKSWLPSLILLISLLFVIVPSPFSRFIETPPEVSPSLKATLDISLNNLKAGHYLLGSGPDTFGNIYNLYKPVSINQTNFWSVVFNSGASAMTTWIGTVGILGMLALLFLIVAFIYTGIAGTAVRNASRGIMNVASQSVFVGVSFLFLMWFLYAVNFTVMALTFWGIGLFLAASLYFVMESNQDRSVFREIRLFTSPPKTFLFSLLIVALMFGAVIGIYFEINRYVAELYFSKAVAEAKADNTAQTIGLISKAASFWAYDERFYQSLAQVAFFEINTLMARKDLPQQEIRSRFQDIINTSTGAAKRAAELNPQNPFNYTLLGNIYENLIQFVPNASDFALSSYGAAISLDPKNPADRVAIARIHIARKELDKATLNLEEAIKLKTDYAPSRFLLVQIYDEQGKTADAIKRAGELVMLNNTDVGALFQLGFLYYKDGQYEDAKIVFERTVELSPNYSNARYFLGLIYDRESVGAAFAEASAAKVKAIEHFQKIAELNPDNEEIKKIIANLAAKKPALAGITPPAPAPQNRLEAPVQEGTGAPVQKLKK